MSTYPTTFVESSISMASFKKKFDKALKKINTSPPAKIINKVCIIDVRPPFTVLRKRLDVTQLNENGMSAFEFSKYCRNNRKYKTGVTKYEYINIPHTTFDIHISRICKYIIPVYDEIWLVGKNDFIPRELKNKYFKDDTHIINKWDMHECTYESTGPFICNSLVDSLCITAKYLF